ncbi:MAG: hypothetical protein ACMXYM_03020 [Candidatus Woesearchaeota archaeon]
MSEDHKRHSDHSDPKKDHSPSHPHKDTRSHAHEHTPTHKDTYKHTHKTHPRASENTHKAPEKDAKPSPYLAMIRNPRVILLLVALIVAFILIAPDPTATGVVITGVERDSPAQAAGVYSGFIVTELMTDDASVEIDDALGFEVALAQMPVGSSFTLIGPDGAILVELDNMSGSETGLSFITAPRSNVKLGLDLSGGTRILISIDEEIDQEVYGALVDAIRTRLNVFGLSDVVVRPSTDLSGNQYVLVELAGISEQQVRDVVASQGVFEAKIVNDTVFEGGRDITSVCRSAECSGIDPFQGCRQMGQEWVCSFFFQITLRPEAAQRSADLTRDIPVVGVPGQGQFLAENLSLYLDGELVDALRISAGLRGQATTTISISGAGYGLSQSEAREDALDNMRRLQTILQTGSLPVQISIVRTDTVSPSLGDEFLRNALLVGLLVLLSVIVTLVAVYRTPQLAIPITIVALSELVLILGVAAAINWSLDLASIAGIIVAIGTGVDDQIIIANEVLRGRKSRARSWKQMITAAFFIILGAYATTVAAMLPLIFAGAGLLRGFALTTIIGVTIGVIITRPAFAAILEPLIGGDKK